MLAECESAHARRTAPQSMGQPRRQMDPPLGTAKETGTGAPPWGKTLSTLRLGTEHPQQQLHDIHGNRKSSNSEGEEGRREETTKSQILRSQRPQTSSRQPPHASLFVSRPADLRAGVHRPHNIQLHRHERCTTKRGPPFVRYRKILVPRGTTR